MDGSASGSDLPPGKGDRQPCDIWPKGGDCCLCQLPFYEACNGTIASVQQHQAATPMAHIRGRLIQH
eukprot:1141662-Pelagomonas_calceolata.AAC.1